MPEREFNRRNSISDFRSETELSPKVKQQLTQFQRQLMLEGRGSNPELSRASSSHILRRSVSLPNLQDVRLSHEYLEESLTQAQEAHEGANRHLAQALRERETNPDNSYHKQRYLSARHKELIERRRLLALQQSVLDSKLRFTPNAFNKDIHQQQGEIDSQQKQYHDDLRSFFSEYSHYYMFLKESVIQAKKV